MGPGLAPIVVAPAVPKKIAKGFMDFGPDPVAILDASHIAHERFELAAGLVEFRGVGLLGGGLGTPEAVGQAKLDPPLLVGGEIEGAGFLVGLASEGEGAVGEEL